MWSTTVVNRLRRSEPVVRNRRDRDVKVEQCEIHVSRLSAALQRLYTQYNAADHKSKSYSCWFGIAVTRWS